jgi:ADP-ribosylglycohydrolase
MRVSPCGYLNLNTPPPDPDQGIVKIGRSDLVKKSAEITHNHPEGIKGALIVSTSIANIEYIKIHFQKSQEELDRLSKILLSGFINSAYIDYDLSKSLDDRRPLYKFDSTCQGSVPESIQCVIEAKSYENAIKLAISMGGDTDTMACIAGSIAGCLWEKPDELVDFAFKKLDSAMIEVVKDFDKFIGI